MLGKVGAVLAPVGFGLWAIALLAAGGANAGTDVTPPALTLPAAATTNATTSQGAVVSFSAVATDDVQPTSLICAPGSGTRFAVGLTSVACSATDAASHSTSGTFAVTVLSASDQLALLRTAVVGVHLPADLQQGLLDKLDAAQASIAGARPKVACNQLNAFEMQVKAQTGKAIADGSDLLKRQHEIEAALDCVPSTAAPVLLGPRADVTTTTAPGLPTATVRFTGPSCAPASPATLGLGANPVQCSATDPNGTTRASFVVTVIDKEPPVLTLPADITVTAPAGSSTAPVDFTVGATDNVPGVSARCTPASGTPFPYGATPVSCTATDTSGNTATGTFRVTVNFAISGRVTSSAGGAGVGGVGVELFGPGGTPNLGLSSTTASDGGYSIVAPPGSYSVFFNRAFTSPYSRQWWNHEPENPDTLVVQGSVGGIDATLSPGVFVHGRVTDKVTGQGIARVFASAVDATAPCCRAISGRGTDDDGDYTFVVPAGSSIKVQFTIRPDRRYMNEWWNDKRTFDTATTFTVNAETFHIDAALTPAVLISGTVTDEQTHDPLASIGVSVTDATTPCCPFGNIAFVGTGPDGGYSVLVPKGQPIKINFFSFGSADPHYFGEWFDGRPNWDQATIRTFTADTPGINAALARGFFISGHVTRSDGSPIGGLFANANDGLAGCCHFITGSRTNASGDYRILVRPGTYKVLFFSRPGFLANDGVTYIDQWWNDSPSFEHGSQVVVSTADVGGINAAMTRAVIVSGHVSDASGLVPVAGFQVNALDASGPCCRFVGGAQTDSHGDYSIAVPPGLTVKVDFGVFSSPPPGTRYLPQWWNNKTSFETGDPILAAADMPNINARLANGLVVTGHVSERESGAALADVHVQVIDPAVPCCPFREIAHTQTNATGDYAFVVAAGSYKVQFFEFPLPAVHPHVSQWWLDKLFDQGADLLVVAADRSGIDETLPLAVFISGRVTNADGTVPMADLNVSAQDASQSCCHFVGGGRTDASGNYRIAVPVGSSVKVEFGVFGGPPPGTRYLGQWWDNKPDFTTANVINALSDVPGIDAHLASGFFVTGHVSNADGTVALAGIGVNANDATLPCCQFIVGTQTDALGSYRLVVPAGRRIRVFFSTNTNVGVRYIPQWYNGKPFFDQADDIEMTQDRGGIDAHLATGVLIHGRVTDATGTIPVAGLNVSAQDASQFCCRFVSGARTDIDGQYTMVVPSSNDVKIEFGVFNPLPGSHLLGQWFRNKPDFGSADPVPTDSDQNNIDARLETGFLISGTVTGPAGPVANVFVNASLGGSAFCCQGVGGVGTDTAGHFQIPVRSGTYRLQASPQPNTHLREQWWNGVPGGAIFFDRAADIVVGSEDVSGTDFTLAAGTLIQGHISDAANGQPIGGGGINIFDAGLPCCQALAFTGTAPDGSYGVVVPSGSRIRVFFFAGPDVRYLGQWWDNKPSFETADIIDASADRAGIDAHLARAAVISGRVTNSDGSIGVAGVQVNALDGSAPCCQFRAAQTDAQGNYSFSVVPGRSVKVAFGVFGGLPPGTRYLAQWWDNKSTFENADRIETVADVGHIDAHLANGFLVSGHVSEPGGAALAGVHVQVIDSTVPCCPFREVANTQTNAFGDYSLALLAGSYKVQFFEFPFPAHPHMNQWWQDKPFDQGADLLVVASDRSAIDAVLAQAVFIRGRVTEASGTVGIPGVFVSSSDATLSCCQFVAGSSSDDSGNYSYIVPLGSSLKVQFSPPPGSPYIGQWWDNKRDFTSADPLSMTMDRNGIDARLAITSPLQFTAQSTASNVVTVTYSKPACRTIPLNPADWTVSNLSAGFVDPVVGDGTPICNVTFNNAVNSARLFLAFPVPPGAVVEVHLNELVPGAGNNPDIRDAAGNLVTAPQVQTAAATAPPTMPPTITSASGSVGATTVTINFSEPVFCPTPLFVGQFTLNSGNPAVTDPTFTAISFTPCAPTQTTASSSFALQTSTPLPANTNYTLTFAPFASNEIENVYLTSVVNPPGIASTTFNTGVP